MAQKSKGKRHKTRRKLTKKGGKTSNIGDYLQSFEEGERVRLHLDSAVHEGFPHPRFHSRTGTVKEQRGQSYIVAVKDGGKVKELSVHPAHLKQVQ